MKNILLHEDKIKFYQKMCYLAFLNWDIDNKTSNYDKWISGMARIKQKIEDNKLIYKKLIML